MTTGCVAYTLFAEFLPSKSDDQSTDDHIYSGWLSCDCFTTRGKFLIVQGVFWSSGALFSVFLAWVTLYYLNWRWYLIFSAVPLMFATIGAMFINESPHFLVVSNQYPRAVKLLKEIAEYNGATLPPGKLEPTAQISEHCRSTSSIQHIEPNLYQTRQSSINSTISDAVIPVEDIIQSVKDENRSKRGNVCGVFTKKYRDTTILLYIIYSCCVFAYYGISFISVRYFDYLDNVYKLDTELYWEMTLTTASEIPALILGLTFWLYKDDIK